MIRLKLRTLDRQVLRMRQTVMYWQAQDMPVTYVSPPRLNRYIGFRASGVGGDWNGLIAMDDWLLSVAPSVARLATGSNNEAQLLKLFAATPQVLALPDALAYHALHVEGLIDGVTLPLTALPCIATAQGQVWLQTLPEIIAPLADTVVSGLQALPVPLQFELGCSRISASLLSQIAIGDALLIWRVASRIACHGMTVGRYAWTKEGIIVDQLQENYRDESLLEDGSQFDEMDDESGDELGNELGNERGNQRGVETGAATSPRSVARVPVRLEFTLGSKLITVGELSRLSVGELLELQPDSEKRISVFANGVLFGHGELIQLDDRLAVEINQLYGGNSDA